MATWTLITGMDAPSSNVFALTGLTLTGYKLLQVVCSGIVVNTDATNILLTLYVASSEITAAYRWAEFRTGSAATSGNAGDVSDPSIALSSQAANWNVGNAAGEHWNGTITIDQPISTAFYKRAYCDGAHVGPTGAVILQHSAGIMENAGAIDGLKISGSSNLTAGKVRLLGLA